MNPLPGPSSMRAAFPVVGGEGPSSGEVSASSPPDEGNDADEDMSEDVADEERMSSAASSTADGGGGGVAVGDPDDAEAVGAEEEQHIGVGHFLLREPPLTPGGADSFAISSSTGMGLDSVPPTPVDIHGDNDLSVPSPGVGIGGSGRQPPLRRGAAAAAAEADDMVDSTVDSSGLPLPRGEGIPGLDYDVGKLHSAVPLIYLHLFPYLYFTGQRILPVIEVP